MKKEITQRIKELGGKINNDKAISLQEFLLSIEFDYPLYQNPNYIPITENRFKEPLFEIDDFLLENKNLFETNTVEFNKKTIDKYASTHDNCFGQYKWEGILYTPLTRGTNDYNNALESFSFEKEIVEKVNQENKLTAPEFIEIFYICSNLIDYYSTYFYICTTDIQPENPSVYSTSEDCHFCKLENEGTFEFFLNTLMTKKELLETMKNYYQKQ